MSPTTANIRDTNIWETEDHAMLPFIKCGKPYSRATGMQHNCHMTRNPRVPQRLKNFHGVGFSGNHPLKSYLCMSNYTCYNTIVQIVQHSAPREVTLVTEISILIIIKSRRCT